VGNETVEYVGAPQKRFAWAIGLSLATLMVYLVVIHDVRGPINMITCVICLLLLIAAGYLALLLFLSSMLHTTLSQPASMNPATQSSSNNSPNEERCRVPEFAKKMGHEEKWKLHNGC
jgi:hypothetical protein